MFFDQLSLRRVNTPYFFKRFFSILKVIMLCHMLVVGINFYYGFMSLILKVVFCYKAFNFI